MKKEHAKALYKMGGESKAIALEYFSEKDLVDTRPKSWGELAGVKGWYIDSWSGISEVDEPVIGNQNKNTFPTREYAEATLALAQLLQIKQRWFDGKLDYDGENVLGISHDTANGELGIYEYSMTPYWTHFPTLEMAEAFLNEPKIRKLLKQVKPLL